MLNIKTTLAAFFALALICGNTSCKKTEEEKRKKFFEANGTIINAGSVAADGCGWLFDIEGERYHADNFTGAPGLDNKKIIINATVTADRFHCGWNYAGEGMPVIHITKMITF